MSHTTPAQQFGYLQLTNKDNGKQFIIKANQITVMTPDDSGALIEVNEMGFYVSQTIEQILDQLESIHAHMR